MESMNMSNAFGPINQGGFASDPSRGISASPMGGLDESARKSLQFDNEESKFSDKIDKIGDEQADFLASKINQEFNLSKSAKLLHEKIMILAHQNIKGVYSADMDFGTGTSRAFVQITRPKVQTYVGMIYPILMPNGTNAWTIDADPIAYNPSMVKNLLAQGVPPDQIRGMVQKKAEEGADRLTTKIKDGLTQTNWPSKLVRTVLDAGSYGTSIILGPLGQETGVAPDPLLQILGEQDEWRPELEVLSPFDVYPDPGARSVEECEKIIIRKILNRAQLRKLKKMPGFDADKIDDVLTRYPEGFWTPEWWESIVNITNSQTQMSAPNGRFICLVRWGWLSGRDLERAGIHDIPEDMMEDQVMAQVWCIGSTVISIRTSELHKDRLPFYFTPFNVVPHSIWGMGIPEEMFDSQDCVNACERAKMDNMALSSRPMAWINVDRIEKGQTIELKAGATLKVRESETSDSRIPPVNFFSPECRMSEIQAVQDKGLYLSQEQTGMPNALMGMGGEGIHNRTSSGASLQFNAAITPLKTVTFNFENHLIIPLLESMIKFYQLFSKDQVISGNFKVSARGVQGIMARESLLNVINTTIQALGQTPEGSKRLDFEQIGDLLIRYNDLVDCRIVLPDSVVQENEKRAMEQKLQMEQGQAAIQTTADKIRAETSPKDALLELYKGAPEGSLAKINLMEKAAQAFGFLDQALKEAIGFDEEAAEIGFKDVAHEAGANQADRIHSLEPKRKSK